MSSKIILTVQCALISIFTLASSSSFASTCIDEAYRNATALVLYEKKGFDENNERVLEVAYTKIDDQFLILLIYPKHEIDFNRKLTMAVMNYYFFRLHSFHLSGYQPEFFMGHPQTTEEYLALPGIENPIYGPENFKNEICISKETLPENSKNDCLSGKKTLDLVTNYFFANQSYTSHLGRFSQGKSHLLYLLTAPKFGQKVGASLMRIANIAGESSLDTPKWIGPVFGLFEKSMSRFFSLPEIMRRTEENRAEILKAINDYFDNDNAELTHQERHYKTLAKEALLEILNETEDTGADQNLKMHFVELKGVADLVAISRSELLGMLTKIVITPLQFHQLFSKISIACGPVLHSLLKTMRTTHGSSAQGDLDELEHIIFEGITQNKPHVLNDGGRCMMVLTKFGTTIYTTTSIVGLLAKNRLGLAAVEALNAISSMVFEALPKNSNNEEIHSMVAALAETFEMKMNAKTPSENLQKYIDLFRQTSGNLSNNELGFLSSLQNHLAEQLITKDSQLLSFIILSSLVDDDRNGTNRMEVFLTGHWGVALNVVRRWTQLANHFGPNTNFIKQCVIDSLRIGF